MGWNDVFGLGLVLGLGAVFALTKHLNDKDRGEEAPFGCGCGSDADDPTAGCAGCPVATQAKQQAKGACVKKTDAS
ncbi:MAG: hypothetical protein PHX58_07695 [Desulfovibrio sp.]|jgi:hypothetical protein|nr:hypothetical protein [Desulfovibrio sp.]